MLSITHHPSEDALNSSHSPASTSPPPSPPPAPVCRRSQSSTSVSAATAFPLVSQRPLQPLQGTEETTQALCSVNIGRREVEAGHCC